jgi:hypothetical protein
MNTPPTITESHPPRLFPTLVSGFNTVANNIWLIAIPVVLDAALWLAPKLRMDQLILPRLSDMSKNLLQLEGTDLQSTLDSMQKMWVQFFTHFNLAAMIRTFPIGVPTFLSRETIVDSPIPNTLQYQVPSTRNAFLILFALILIGFFFGSLYFNSLAQVTAKSKEKINFEKLLFQFGQSIAMALILIIVVLILAFPAIMLLSAILFINAQLADFAFLLGIFAVFWLVMPLVFSPHGIFVINQKAFPSMMLSMRMIRYFLPGTGMFVVTAAVISEGLNLVWAIPESTSWLMTVSIFGHAFIVTALLAASFIYYREGLRWMQETIQHMSTPMSKPV